jgi:hypothetical protein
MMAIGRIVKCGVAARFSSLPFRDFREASELLLREAEECFRWARVPGLRKEIAEGLEAAGHEFMAAAVEIETMLQRDKWKNRNHST